MYLLMASSEITPEMASRIEFPKGCIGIMPLFDTLENATAHNQDDAVIEVQHSGNEIKLTLIKGGK